MACKLQKCGHCDSLQEDDQCGLPEHRYCMFCHTKEASDESDAWASRMYDAVTSALKELDVQQAGASASVTHAVELLKKALNS